MRAAVSLLPSTPLWRGAQLKKHRDNFTFYFYHQPRGAMEVRHLPEFAPENRKRAPVLERISFRLLVQNVLNIIATYTRQAAQH